MIKEVFIKSLNSKSHSFQETMDYIEANYRFTPVAFTVGEQVNESGTNQGSCKIFCLGKDLNLSEEQVLECFGDFYRNDVLKNPEGDDHQNIRNFIKHGWSGVKIEANALTLK
ncbi:HopJ type III effector protein [Litoribacillus peritrichatus]|uniref:HopJ type III effector protein n=1 Tax=Litoribacillus peritrichatus TaxID=718191 RepID=A0ABP7N004_9GAMM